MVVTKEALGKGLGIDEIPARRGNLDKYAGDSDFGPEWDEFLEGELKRVEKVGSLPETVLKTAILANLRTRLFGSEMAHSIHEDLIMEPVWREEDEADDSWWIDPPPASP